VFSKFVSLATRPQSTDKFWEGELKQRYSDPNDCLIKVRCSTLSRITHASSQQDADSDAHDHLSKGSEQMRQWLLGLRQEIAQDRKDITQIYIAKYAKNEPVDVGSQASKSKKERELKKLFLRPT
jgi:hypothetical protein